MPPLVFVAAGIGIAFAALGVVSKVLELMDRDDAPPADEAGPDPVTLVYDPATDTYAPDPKPRA